MKSKEMAQALRSAVNYLEYLLPEVDSENKVGFQLAIDQLANLTKITS